MPSYSDIINSTISKYSNRVVKHYEWEDAFFRYMRETPASILPVDLIEEYEQELDALLWERYSPDVDRFSPDSDR